MPGPGDNVLPGLSLFDGVLAYREGRTEDAYQIWREALNEAEAAGPDDPDRVVFSEYHAAGAKTAAYMLRRGKFKYIHYVELEQMDELYDLKADPYERNNVIDDPAYAATLEEMKVESAELVK